MENANNRPQSSDASLSAAWASFEAGRLDDAIQLARQAIEQAHSDNPNADAALGWFLLSADSVAEAEATLMASLGRYPGHAPVHWYLGLVFVRQSRREEACQALAAAVSIDPGLDEAAVTLAWILGDLGRYDEATVYSRSALSTKALPDRRAQLGWLLICQEQWEEAASQLAEVVSVEPLRQDARSHLATALQRLGRSDEALTILSDGLMLSPGSTELLRQKTHLLFDMHRTQEARTACHGLLKLQSQEGMDWYLLALVQVQGQRPGVAARAIARALRLAPERPEIWSQSAWLALAAGNIGAARTATAHVLRLAPADPASNILAANVMEADGDLANASVHAEIAVDRAKRSATAWHTLAQVRSRQSRWLEAESALRTALVLDPVDGNDAYRQLGWLCMATQRPEEGVTAFAAATNNTPQDAASWCGLAEAYRVVGRYPQALEAIDQALLLHNDWPAALTVHGHILLDSGPDTLQDAVLELSKALSLEPAQTEARRLMSDALHRLKRDDESLAVLEDGLAHAPEAGQLLEQRVHLLLDMRRTKDARAACHALLRQQPRDGIHWYLLARVLVQGKRPRVAVRALCRALRHAPDSIDVCRQIGWLAMEAGNPRTAREAVERVLALAPADTASDILAAVVMDASGNQAVALEHAERAVAGATQSAPAWRTLAQVRARQGRNEEAKAALTKALELDPATASDTYRQLGWLFREERHYEEAATAFRAAVTSDPKDASSWFGLADVYRADGKFADALKAIKPTLSLREEWNDRQLRGQIIHEQVYYYLKKKWSDLGGIPQPLHVQPVPNPSHRESMTEPLSATGDAHTPPKAAEKYEYIVCSLSTKSHLPLLNTFAQSVRRHFSGRIYLLVVDSDDAGLIPEGTTLVRLSEVIEPSVWQEMVERYNILELCCALKSFLMRFLAKTVGCPIIYMDADTYALGPLDALLPDRPDFSVFLTPHLLHPYSGDQHAEEIGMLCVGVYNGGMLGVGLGEDGIRFLDWWLDRVSRYAYDSREQGVFTDQKWLDLVPCFFKGVHISRAPGLNLGHWRVCSERDFALDTVGKLTFCGEPVTVLHMSGFKSNRPDLLAQHLRPTVVQDSPLGNFLRRYAQEVIQNRH